MGAAAEKLELSAIELAEAQTWAIAHRDEVPVSVYKAILLLALLRGELTKVKQRAGHLVASLRRELGITPKSERGSPSATPPADKLSDEECLEKLQRRRKKLLKEIRRYEDRLGKRRKTRQQSPKKTAPAPTAPPADASLAPSHEALFAGNLAVAEQENNPLKVDRVENFVNPVGLHSSSDERTRHDFKVTTKTHKLSVETVTDPRTGKSVTASTDHIGPPNSQATWSGIANTIIAVIGYAIPINRLSTMLKAANPYFTSSRLCSYLQYAAQLFEPVYTFLGQQLADSEVLLGDDTTGQVIEINRAQKEGGELPEPPPESLISKVADVFGRVFPKKRGIGKKRQLNISVVIGKTNATDPRSYVFFFRAHLGSLGDLLSKILESRSPKHRNLTVITDLSTTNHLSPEHYQRFKITHAGCLAHARRPFWRYKDQDQRLCYWMLSAFLVLEQIEDRIDELGRTRATIERYRGRYSSKVWAAMHKRCASVLRGEKIYGHYWPKNSKIYAACEYIIKHYPELTVYLHDARIPSSNNLSERVLRWDKIMQDASKFRKTEAGRLHVDILRTIVHTCSAAEVELQDYLVHVFKNREAVKQDPSQYTPYAFALHLAAKTKGNPSPNDSKQN